MMKQFKMSQEQLEEIYNASKPTPVMYLTGGKPMFNSPQENANYAWQKLGEELGFVWDTARPVMDEEPTIFMAEEIKIDK